MSYTKWSVLKSKMEGQLSIDPQRATLALRAIKGVEEGLAYLAHAGYSYELSPKGLFAELIGEGVHNIVHVGPTSMTIDQATDRVQPPPVENSASEVFDAE